MASIPRALLSAALLGLLFGSCAASQEAAAPQEPTAVSGYDKEEAEEILRSLHRFEQVLLWEATSGIRGQPQQGKDAPLAPPGKTVREEVERAAARNEDLPASCHGPFRLNVRPCKDDDCPDVCEGADHGLRLYGADDELVNSVELCCRRLIPRNAAAERLPAWCADYAANLRWDLDDFEAGSDYRISIDPKAGQEERFGRPSKTRRGNGFGPWSGLPGFLTEEVTTWTYRVKVERLEDGETVETFCIDPDVVIRRPWR